MALIPQTALNYELWSKFLSQVRRFFLNRGYLEINTPLLVEAGAFESSIDPLQVSWKGGKGELHTSPEIAMKEALALLKRPIFQICKCFRDDLESPHHSREFTMLEFYEPGTTYKEMKGLVKDLVTVLAGKEVPFEEKTAEALLKTHAGIELKEVKAQGSDTWEDVFFKAWIEHVEPRISPLLPTIVTDYPVPVSPLSKQIEGEALAERFELYWKGMEICNGCTELTDRNELKKRHGEETAKRIAQGKVAHPFSERLAKATSEIGSAAGVAVGLDRLFLCFHSQHS